MSWGPRQSWLALGLDPRPTETRRGVEGIDLLSVFVSGVRALATLSSEASGREPVLRPRDADAFSCRRRDLVSPTQPSVRPGPAPPALSSPEERSVEGSGGGLGSGVRIGGV